MNRLLLKLAALLSREDLHKLDRFIHSSLFLRDQGYVEHLHYFYWENQIDFWYKLPPPVRPSVADIVSYRKCIEQGGRIERLLILGATPELRDLVVMLPPQRPKIYLADFSYRLPLAMVRFMVHGDPAQETWVKGSWLDLPFPEGFFDVILGDLVLQQFPPDLEPLFLEKMCAHLKAGGSFIGRFHFLDHKLQEETIPAIVSNVLSADLPDEAKFILLKLRILWQFADFERRDLRRELSVKRFDEFMQQGAHPKILHDVRESMRTDRDSFRSWSPPSEEELLNILGRSFSLKERRAASDYRFAHYYPLFRLVPR